MIFKSTFKLTFKSWRRYSGYFEDSEKIEALRVEYCNCVNAIEFQNEMLAQLVEELLEMRRQLRSGEVTSRKDSEKVHFFTFNSIEF